ncbi:MAG TPA: hypothetical protein VFO10_03855 [Oligoflexus sp.]|uniref:hypothetical protein n=1 Tax=Oligoflexus sp. TaxID=1971216 RepID=UPI002D7FBAEB|nr:hypothetical protein [Oligoflexus sp.]HET9236353.1 hypothetical protein [Oligoflexus sp.]
MLRSVLKSLRGSDWSLALDFLSPSFFEVVPTLGMTRLITTLTKNSMNRELYESTAGTWLPIQRGLQDSQEPPGQLVLKLYFAAFLGPRPCFLDLRAERFQTGSWNPQPWIFAFSDDFTSAMRRVYQGFYENEPQLFQDGLKALDLQHSEELFLDLFGRVQDGTMVFRLQDFRDSFHRIFVSCKENKTSLHPEFLPLGLLLFSLYEHAEHLGLPLSPAEAWRSVRLYFSKSKGESA